MSVVLATRITSIAFVTLFAISTIHLIVHSPEYPIRPEQEIRKRSLPLTETEIERSNKYRFIDNNKIHTKYKSPSLGTNDVDNHSPNNNKKNNSNDVINKTNYAIFDSSLYSGNLRFLDVKQDGWKILVINLRNISQLVTCEVCYLLKDEWIKSNIVDQWWIGYHGSDIDANGLAKMAAYVYALSQGAPWIYVTDRPSPIPYKMLMSVAKHEVRTGLVYQGPQEVFEPCNHFMDPYTWEGRIFHKEQGRYNVKVVPSHSVYHVVNGCFKKGAERLDLEKALDTKAPLPFVMPGSFGAVDFNTVLVSNPNAWTLIASVFSQNEENPLPSNKAVRVNLMVQRVLWESQSSVGFLPDQRNDFDKRCPTCEIHGLIMANKSNQWKPGDGSIHKHLTQWRCEFYESVPRCLQTLASEDGISDKNTQQLMHLWISLLESYGWRPLERYVFSDERAIERLTGIPVYFSPAKSLHKIPTNDTRPVNIFRELCKEDKRKYLPKIPDNYIFQDIILIIVLNFGNLVSNIPLLDYVYGRHFKYIIYCSESVSQFESRYKKFYNASPVTFVEIQHKRGYWGQSCMAATMKIGYDVTGFLQLSDDVLLNVWNLGKLPYHKPWFQSMMRVANIHNQIVPDVWINNFWWPWNQFFGRVAALEAFRQLQSLVSSSTQGERVTKFLDNLHNITNCDQCFLYEASDVFYVPAHLISSFTFFSDIFSHSKVFLEIAIPTILAGITSDADVYRLRGNYLWFQDREKYPFVYTKYDHFYHAFKFSHFAIPKHLKYYCKNFLGMIDKDAMKARNDRL